MLVVHTIRRTSVEKIRDRNTKGGWKSFRLGVRSRREECIGFTMKCACAFFIFFYLSVNNFSTTNLAPIFNIRGVSAGSFSLWFFLIFGEKNVPLIVILEVLLVI